MERGATRWAGAFVTKGHIIARNAALKPSELVRNTLNSPSAHFQPPIG